MIVVEFSGSSFLTMGTTFGNLQRSTMPLRKKVIIGVGCMEVKNENFLETTW